MKPLSRNKNRADAICVGTIVAASTLTDAGEPGYRLTIDFGECGIRHAAVHILKLGNPSVLIGRQVLGTAGSPCSIAAFAVSDKPVRNGRKFTGMY